jgi:ketosteroid isomerase-like protein
MSRENVEIVLDLFEATNARKFAHVFALYADDVVLHLHGEIGAVAGDGAVGKPAVGRWFDDWFATFDRDYRFELLETQDHGDRVLILAVHHARGRTSGVVIERPMAWIYTLRDREIVRCDAYDGRSQALAAL